MSRRFIAIVLLGVFGAILLPFQNSLYKEQRAANLRATTLDMSLREQVGQMGFIAALSGFRSPLAAILWIEAYTAWEKTEWGRMAGLFNTATTLQPRSVTYWDQAAWHMAWNASVAAINDKEKQPSEALRIRNQRQFFELGREYLERGIKNNPDSAYLNFAMGTLLRDKLEDFCKASEYFLKASEIKGAPSYYARMAGYAMAKCPEKEQEAYDLLKKLYDMGPDQRKPTLITNLKELEKKLDVPPAERIDSPDSQP
jgi:hypothetical protein